MSLTAADKVIVLQRMVNSYANDLLALHAVFADPSTPEAAQRYLLGGLNYALDKLDIYPDHNGGIGLADDAIVLRLAAKLAREAGAKQKSLEPLVLDANNVISLFEDLAAPLERLVAQFPEREVRGRTADKILSHNYSRACFDSDISNEAKRYTPQKIGTTEDAPRAVAELHKRIKAALKSANLL